jgi:hypothetical protein
MFAARHIGIGQDDNSTVAEESVALGGHGAFGAFAYGRRRETDGPKAVGIFFTSAK